MRDDDRGSEQHDGWQPPDFDLDSEDIKKYREIYRFFPAYAELLL